MTHETPGGAKAPSESGAQIAEKAWALHSFGRIPEAIAMVRKGLSEHPADPELNGSLAWMEFFHGDHAEADIAARAAVAARPADWRGLTILVELAVARGDVTDAEETANAMVGLLPNWQGAHLALAFARNQPRKESRAQKKLRWAAVAEHVAAAVELAPEDVDTLRRGAILLNAVGKREDAEALLNRALALDPDNEELRLLTLQVTPQKETEAVRLLTGVLAQNPQQREVARVLSDTVWARTRQLAALATYILVAMMLFAYLVFGDEVSLSHKSMRDLGMLFLAIPFAWLMLFVSLGRALPPRYLFRLWKPVWWVWFALALAAVVGLATVFMGFAFTARSQPAMLRVNGGYAGALTRSVGWIAVAALCAELGIIFARFRSERINKLFADGTAGAAAAREELKNACWGLIVTALAVVVALVPTFAAPIATSPEAASGFKTVAIALGAPPLVVLVLAFGRYRAHVSSRMRTWPFVVFALVAAAAAVTWGAQAALAHGAEYDPPPSPYSLELQEKFKKIAENQEKLEKIGERISVPE